MFKKKSGFCAAQVHFFTGCAKTHSCMQRNTKGTCLELLGPQLGMFIRGALFYILGHKNNFGRWLICLLYWGPDIPQHRVIVLHNKSTTEEQQIS